MQSEQFTIICMFYLIACALHDTKPDENKLDGLKINELYNLARKHSLAAMVYMALDGTDILKQADPELKKQWKESKEKAIRKNILLDVEREQIFDELEKRHIWYMPLKGSVLKKLYPKDGMREMADNDILYDGEYQKDVKKIFTERGYKTVSYAIGNHDVYEKEPLYNYEMHTALFSYGFTPKQAAFFDRIQDKLIADGDSAYGRHLSNEDLYIYITAHAYKHYSDAGTGFRILVDLYVMNKCFGKTMDRKYVSEQLNVMEMSSFEESSRTLAEHLFDVPEPVDLLKLQKNEMEIMMQCCDSGAFGTFEGFVNSHIKKYNDEGTAITGRTRLKYYIRRLFPGREWFKTPYSFFYRYPVFIPFFWIYRIFRTVLHRRKQVGNEINALRKMK